MLRKIIASITGSLVLCFLLLAPSYVRAECNFGDFEMPIGGISGCVDDFANKGMAGYVGAIYNIMIGIVILAALIMIVGAGYFYMTAGGSAQQVGKAKTMIVSALIGITLALTAYLILNTLNDQFVSSGEGKFGGDTSNGGGGNFE